MSRSDILKMPVFERRFYLQLQMDAVEESNEQIEAARNNAGSGKGRKSETLSGEALKNKIKNNEIPN